MKLALASIGFLLFAILGIIVSIGVFSPAVEHFNTTVVLVGTIFISLIFFYFSILKR
jgi:uncharacterized membrane protein YcaP (DUF421 family)